MINTIYTAKSARPSLCVKRFPDTASTINRIHKKTKKNKSIKKDGPITSFIGLAMESMAMISTFVIAEPIILPNARSFDFFCHDRTVKISSGRFVPIENAVNPTKNKGRRYAPMIRKETVTIKCDDIEIAIRPKIIKKNSRKCFLSRKKFFWCAVSRNEIKFIRAK